MRQHEVARDRAEFGKITCRYDEKAEVITIESRGLWTVEQVDRACDNASALVARLRQKGAPIRVIVDRSSTLEQTEATSERLRLRTMEIFDPGDRIAVLVDSSVAKMRTRRSLDPQTHKMFASRNAAWTWLTAHDRPK